MKTAFETSGDAKARVIAAAIHLFTVKGIANVSLRELTTAAGVNLAAVNYHFGSKAALCESVLDALAVSANQKRLASLADVLEHAEVAGTPPSLHDVLNTFMQPYFDADNPGEGELLAQLVLKDRVDGNEMTARIVRKRFDPLAREYIAAFAKACPHVDPLALYWRYLFMAHTVVLTSKDRGRKNRLATISKGQIDGSDAVALKRALIDFLVPAISGNTSNGVEAPPRANRASSQKSRVKS